ncbi:hypothetical protein [Mesorhizobium prunaredense]|nr:hypothetical protein [Mesorhizobium prunaredense]
MAIIIGVGSTMVGANWIKEARPPNLAEFEQIAIVLIALYATVLSWDGYLISISKKPLINRWRFAIDVALVFTYMFLLVASENKVFWLPTFNVIFLLYFCWDVLSVIEFPSAYATPQAHSSGIRFMLRVYARSFIDDPRFDRGPVSTLVWGVYFLSIYLLSLKFTEFEILALCTFVFLGLWQYRHDKRHHSSGVRGFSMARRLLTAGSLFTIAGLYGRYGPIVFDL